jgi:hypothetical protein
VYIDKLTEQAEGHVQRLLEEENKLRQTISKCLNEVQTIVEKEESKRSGKNTRAAFGAWFTCATAMFSKTPIGIPLGVATGTYSFINYLINYFDEQGNS